MSVWKMNENHFQTWDGSQLFYRSWKPLKNSRKALIVLHRGHEHSGRLVQLVEDLGLEDFWAFGWDARGHGNSPGRRGHAESVQALVQDLDAFVKYVSHTYDIPLENMAVVANSIGGVVASIWVHDYAPPIRSMVLAAPAFRIKLYVPLAIPCLRALLALNKDAVVNSYVKSNLLTHDPEQALAYDADPLITRCISVKLLLEFYDIATRIIADAGAIHTPTQILTASSDWVVKNSAQQHFFDSLSSLRKEIHVFPGFYHALLYEKERQQPIQKAREFILNSFQTPPSRSFLSRADKEGYTKQEFDRLCSPAPLLKAFSFSILRGLSDTLGRLSHGVDLGWKTGFDSGQTLDYVYENKARGKTIVGKLIDRGYLNSLGWKGIRQRKINLKASIKQVIETFSESEDTIHIVDIASGPGRYLFETISEMDGKKEKITLHLRDYNPQNLEVGKALARQFHLKNISFAQGDAFDKESLRSISPKVNVVVVSGLYELFPDNDRVLNSLEGLYEAVEENGYLIYTGQPWHPQIEMIARTLINREGNPWIMRRRTQAEMDELVRMAGFQKIDMKIDSYGIFTVSIAQKN